MHSSEKQATKAHSQHMLPRTYVVPNPFPLSSYSILRPLPSPCPITREALDVDHCDGDLADVCFVVDTIRTQLIPSILEPTSHFNLDIRQCLLLASSASMNDCEDTFNDVMLTRHGSAREPVVKHSFISASQATGTFLLKWHLACLG